MGRYQSPYSDELPVMYWLCKAATIILTLGTSLWLTCTLAHIGHYTWLDCEELAVTLYVLYLGYLLLFTRR